MDQEEKIPMRKEEQGQSCGDFHELTIAPQLSFGRVFLDAQGGFAMAH